MNMSLVTSLENRVKSLRTSLDGFPWLLAGTLYTLSWGWSLLRPNTLYWDDWQYISNQPSRSLNIVSSKFGLPPWRALLDQELFLLGYFTVPALTFLMYFCSGLFLFLLLKKIDFLDRHQIRLLALVFIIAPVNHARIAKVMFGYTTSYFLFFLGWTLFAYSRSLRARLIALFLFFLSFMTHSLLFFFLLPIIHIIYLHSARTGVRKLKKVAPLLVGLLALPILYAVMRPMFWPPQNKFVNYQKIYTHGVLMSTLLFVPFACCSLLILFKYRLKRQLSRKLKVLMIGTFAFAISLLPYLMSNNIDRYIFSFNIGWQSRHLMLTPLGIAFVVAGVFDGFPKRGDHVANIVLTLAVLINVIVGSQYYLQSVQQTEITKLLKKQNIPIVIAEFSDETVRFKGRGATFSEYEFFGMLRDAGYEYPRSVGYEYVCKANPGGLKLTVKSDRSFVNALYTRETGTFLEFTTCAEVLLKKP